MAYKVLTNYVSSSKYSIKCPFSMTPKYIVVHNTANDAPARNEVSYMRNNNKQVSFHAAVDDKEVVLGVPMNRNAWHAGDGGNGKGNRYGIGIEICYSKSGGKKFDAAEKNAAVYIAGLLKARGWGIDRVKRHKDFSGKNCPHRTMDKGWTRFLNMVQAAMNGTTAPSTSKPSTPTSKPAATVSPYKVGKVYTLQANMNVRTGAGTGYRKKKRSELTANARAHCTGSKSAVLRRGTRVTCKAVVKNGNDIWLRIPSGYVCAKKGSKIYIK